MNSIAYWIFGGLRCRSAENVPRGTFRRQYGTRVFLELEGDAGRGLNPSMPVCVCERHRNSPTDELHTVEEHVREVVMQESGRIVCAVLRTKVRIKGLAELGKIEIEFFSKDELNRLLDLWRIEM